MFNEKYTDADRKYWKMAKSLYATIEIKKSRAVIEVDFKNKKIIKGASKAVKKSINSYVRAA